MIKILILGIFAYLIARVISILFDTIEGLFRSAFVQAAKPQVIANNQQINQHRIKPKTQIRQNDKRLEISKNNKHQGINQAEAEEASSSGSIVQLIGIISNNQSKKSSAQEINLVGKDKYKEGVSDSDFRRKSESVQSQKEANSKYFCRFNEVQSPVKISQYIQQIEMLREKLKSYSQNEAEIEQLKKQVEEYQAEKKIYIDRIEDIIQHVIVSQEQNLEEQVTEDQGRELLAINNLKKEINHSYQLEKEREQQLAAELHQNLQREKQELSRAYEFRIDELSRLLAEKQRSNGQLEENVASLNQEKQILIEELNMKKQEIAKLSVVEVEVVSKLQLQSKQQELLRANEQLLSAPTQCQQLESELFQASTKYFQLESRIEELAKEKKEVQNELNRQLEKQFTDEQRRQTEQSERQSALLNKHRLEIEDITMRLQAEQEISKSTLEKYESIKAELQFCQIQMGTASDTEKQLRNQILTLRTKLNQDQALRISLADSQIQNHPVFLKMKQKYEQSQAKLKNLSPIRLAQSNQQSGLSIEVKPAIKLTDSIRSDQQPAFNSPSRELNNSKIITRVSSSIFGNTPSSQKERNSAVFLGSYKEASDRYKTPIEKPLQSSLHESGNLSSTFFGQTSILDEKKRDFAIAEINRLKKIASKKTKLIYRWQGKNSRPITDFTSNVPNIFIVIELPNKKIIGAFSQTAFTKQGNALSQKSKYLAMNKSMIMDISQEKVFPNQTTQQTIKYDEKALIWGRNELVFSYSQPPVLICNLNCENAIYSCQYSTEQLMGDKQNSATINQCEIFRIFLG